MKPGARHVLRDLFDQVKKEAGIQDGTPRWARIITHNLILISVLLAIISALMIVWYSNYDFTDRWQKERNYIHEICKKVSSGAVTGGGQML